MQQYRVHVCKHMVYPKNIEPVATLLYRVAITEVNYFSEIEMTATPSTSQVECRDYRCHRRSVYKACENTQPSNEDGGSSSSSNTGNAGESKPFGFCSICQEEICSSSETLNPLDVEVTMCGHVFHAECYAAHVASKAQRMMDFGHGLGDPSYQYLVGVELLRQNGFDCPNCRCSMPLMHQYVKKTLKRPMRYRIAYQQTPNYTVSEYMDISADVIYDEWKRIHKRRRQTATANVAM